MENNLSIEYLEPIYSTQKSFYKKAKVVRFESTVLLYSYNTLVAAIDNNEIAFITWHSNTTAKHQNEFLKQHRFNAMTKNEMENY